MAALSDVQLFVRDIANTPLKKELIWLLHENRIMDTCHGLASWMNRREADVRAAAEDLVRAGLLQRIGEGEDAIYQYAPPPELASIVEKFITSYASARSLLSDYLSELQSTIEEIQRASLKEIKLERSKLKSIIQSMPVGVIVVDMSGEVVLFNSAAISLLKLKCASDAVIHINQ
ncbi:MAG: PAS domain-containing protein, partial [Armatimonadota bacterium]|nr:PAS domain-containing protein [Armatimonadota bacterium]MDW8143153.1 PAS domain-containing protein [Armatimonadota bacterium]